MFTEPTGKPLPRKVDPRKFVAQGIEVAGDVPVEVFERLGQSLTSTDGFARVELAFGRDEQGLKIIEGKLGGEVHVTCQRCLQAMIQPVAADILLAIVWDEEEARQLPRKVDPIIVGEESIDLYELVEDELLLALPFVSYHDSEQCRSERREFGDAVEDDAPEADNNPFRVLEQLKKSD